MNNSQMRFYETRNHVWRPSPLDLNQNNTLQNFHNSRANEAQLAYSTAGKSFYHKKVDDESSTQVFLDGGDINST